MIFSELIIHTDGGARGNPGPAAVGIVISGRENGNNFLFEHSETIGDQTNNTAEYMAVIQALHICSKKNLTANTLTFVLDSELIVRQIAGQYRVKEPRLQALVGEVHHLVHELKEQKAFDSINFQNVLRHKNKRADQLVNQALDASK